MATKRYARAIVERTNVPFDDWMETLRNQNEGAVPRDHVHRVAKTVLRKCDPKQYLLSHATIVASVDTYAPKGVKTGRQMIQGVQIDVRWPDFRIKPECHEIINNNGDAWERSLLLSTYRTFIGAHNYLEHIQLPDLSKGFIVDAIARDLGKSAYIDILVATDRKHRQLVTDIASGDINAMSMGCISLFTVCTSCGNVAADDSQLCPCVLYVGKGNKFADEQGVEHPVSELIGHVSVPNSNQFIEASWVRNPAFRGAVRRNILNPDSTQVAARLEEAKRVYEIRTEFPLPDGIKKAASSRRAQQDQDSGSSQDLGDLFDQGDQDQGTDQGGQDQTTDQGGQDQGQTNSPAGGSESPKSDKIDEMLDKAQEQLLSIMVDRLGEKLAPKPEDVGTVAPAPSVLGGNDNLVRSSEEFDRRVRKLYPDTVLLQKWASKAYRIVHEGGLKSVRASKMTPKDLIVLSWIEDRVYGRNYSSRLYKTAMKVGPMLNFPSETSFLAACKLRLGRNLSQDEERFLIWKGRIASVSSC
jgi:hypothetical protein